MALLQQRNPVILQDGSLATTPLTSDNSTKIATTEYVKNNLTANGIENLITELDFGNSGKGDTKFNIISLTTLSSDTITTSLAYLQPAGKNLDEVEMDSFFILSKANNGSIDLLIKPLNGTVHDKFKFLSQIIKA